MKALTLNPSPVGRGKIYLVILALNCLACCGASVQHEQWTVPLPPDTAYNKNRLRTIHEILERQIKKVQAYGDSTLELVDYGLITMSNGLQGKKLSRGYDSTNGYLVTLQGLMDYAYVETTFAVFEMGFSGMLPPDGFGNYDTIIDLTRPHPDTAYWKPFFSRTAPTTTTAADIICTRLGGNSRDSIYIRSNVAGTYGNWQIVGWQIDTVNHQYTYDNIDSDSIVVKALDRNGRRAWNDNSQVVYLVWKRDR